MTHREALRELVTAKAVLEAFESRDAYATAEKKVLSEEVTDLIDAVRHQLRPVMDAEVLILSERVTNYIDRVSKLTSPQDLIESI